MKKLKDRVTAITGAGSGMGREIALELANQGCHLAISDINKKNLQETAKMLKDQGVEVSTHVVDVAEREAMFEYAEEAVEHHGKVHMIINNAGVSLSSPVKEMDLEDAEWVMGINFWGVLHGTKAFLPHLEKVEEAHIVNISSIFGNIGVPTQSVYNAAKSAVRIFTETLGEELAIDESHIKVSCVQPGFIRTNLVRNSRIKGHMEGQTEDKDQAVKDFEKIARTTPKKAAKIIIKGIKKNKPRILVGVDSAVIDGLQRALPVGYQKLFIYGFKKMK